MEETINKSKIGNYLLLIASILLLFSCGSVKKKQQKKEIHYELVTTLRDSLVITHEKKETITEKTIERVEDRKEKADNYKRTDKDGTIHEYTNYNTEVVIDEKTKDNITTLISKYNSLEVKFSTLNEKYNHLEEKNEKDRKQLDVFKLIIQVAAAILFIYLLYLAYKKITKVKLI